MKKFCLSLHVSCHHFTTGILPLKPISLLVKYYGAWSSMLQNLEHISFILFLLGCVVYVENYHSLKILHCLKSRQYKKSSCKMRNWSQVEFILHHFINYMVLKLISSLLWYWHSIKKLNEFLRTGQYILYHVKSEKCGFRYWKFLPDDTVCIKSSSPYVDTLLCCSALCRDG